MRLRKSILKCKDEEIVNAYESGLSQYQVGIKFNISQSSVGRILKKQGIRSREKAKVGEEHYLWKGENVSQKVKHTWIRKHFGSATHCENDRNHKSKVYHWANLKDHKYTRNRLDYKMLCITCHRKMDKKKHCEKGHEFTTENTYIRSNGQRRCKICAAIYHKEWVKRRSA